MAIFDLQVLCMKRSLLALCILLATVAIAQPPATDILHYKFQLKLSDNFDSISGHATIRVKWLQSGDSLVLDLTGADAKTGKGMTARLRGAQPYTLTQRGDKLIIRCKKPVAAGEEREIEILYSGVPSDGLIISKNTYGDRTFFADNWPNRAHNWIPCVDQPNDKASVEFLVTAPEHYRVVSNGRLLADTIVDKGWRFTHWQEKVALPTKVMVIGVARFAVEEAGKAGKVPVSSWVFPQNKESGFANYKKAVDVLNFFADYIGPYAYEKLANVQSKTIFGGMENASAIFYYEESAIGIHSEEELIAHEIVHQWFGNMATEENFAHLWLSEGFATYLTHLYMGKQYGADTLAKGMAKDRDRVVAFARRSKQPVIDSLSPYMELLNENSYQKGSWVLHMLRQQTGDDLFQRIIRQYYKEYGGKNARTEDFVRVAEEVSKLSLKNFFQQWLYRAGVPVLSVKWNYDETGKKIILTVKQQQEQLYTFPMEFAVMDDDRRLALRKFDISQRTQSYSIDVSAKGKVTLVADPDVKLLFAREK